MAVTKVLDSLFAKIPQVVRWILFIPLAVLADFVASLLIGLLSFMAVYLWQLTPVFTPGNEQWITLGLQPIAQGIFPPILFVYLGALMAPRGRLGIAVALAVVYIVGYLALLSTLLLSDRGVQINGLIITIISLNVLMPVAGIFVVKRGLRKDSSIR